MVTVMCVDWGCNWPVISRFSVQFCGACLLVYNHIWIVFGMKRFWKYLHGGWSVNVTLYICQFSKIHVLLLCKLKMCLQSICLFISSIHGKHLERKLAVNMNLWFYNFFLQTGCSKAVHPVCTNIWSDFLDKLGSWNWILFNTMYFLEQGEIWLNAKRKRKKESSVWEIRKDLLMSKCPQSALCLLLCLCVRERACCDVKALFETERPLTVSQIAVSPNCPA